MNALEPVSLDTWGPFDAFSLTIASPAISAFSSIRMDRKETPDAHVFIAEVPGLKEEEVILKISGQRTNESSDEFHRTVRLPPSAKIDSVKASLENGLLTVAVPR